MIDVFNDMSSILIGILSSLLNIIKSHPTFDMIIATFVIYDISDRHEQRYNLNNKILFDSYSKLSKIGDKFCHQSFRLLFTSSKLGPNNISNKLKDKVLCVPYLVTAYMCRIDSFRVALIISLRKSNGIMGRFNPIHRRIYHELNHDFDHLHVLSADIIKDFQKKEIQKINKSKDINNKASNQLFLAFKHLYSIYVQIEFIYKEICQYK